MRNDLGVKYVLIRLKWPCGEGCPFGENSQKYHFTQRYIVMVLFCVEYLLRSIYDTQIMPPWGSWRLPEVIYVQANWISRLFYAKQDFLGGGILYSPQVAPARSQTISNKRKSFYSPSFSMKIWRFSTIDKTQVIGGELKKYEKNLSNPPALYLAYFPEKLNCNVLFCYF